MSKPIGVVNVDVDLLSAMAVNGQVTIKLWRAGKALLAKAEAPTNDKNGVSRMAWMQTVATGKTEALLGQKYVQEATFEGKPIKIVKSIVVGCAHLFAPDSSEA